MDAASETLDFSQPIALMLLIVLHMIPDGDDPYGIVTSLTRALPPGSYLVLAHPASDIRTAQQAEMTRRVNERMSGPKATMRDRAAISRFFDGLDLLDPGVVQPQQWRPEPGMAAPGQVTAWCGVPASREAEGAIAMDLGLRGKRALITGGSRGIGFAVAQALAAEGAAVGLVARDTEGLAAAAARLATSGAPTATAAADVTDAQALTQAVDDIAAALGGLDLLVANAGGTVGQGNLTSAQPGEFTATFALNAGHAAELIRAGLPHMRASGGAVVIISSITGMRPAPRTAYAAAKAAEIHLAATAAQELAPYGIRVNAVSPGSIMFPGGGWDSFKQQNPGDFDTFLRTQFPFGRLGHAAEVADVVTFLLSDRASWISGANIAVDGAQIYPSARRFG